MTAVKEMEQWVLLQKGADFKKIAARFSVSPRLACLMRNRGLKDEAAIERYLNGNLSHLYDGMRMQDMGLAVRILRKKIEEKKRIRVIGDYDIDGVNATYILLRGLRMLGADVDSDIPDRKRDGYGLNRELLERAYRDGIDTVITCDNGIAAREEIQHGKNLGMTILVTDHHEVPYEETEGERTYLLPPADAVVDPKRADCGYPFKGLCGAAVAYKLLEAFIKETGVKEESGWASVMDALLENVAVATVGDVMDLVDENRILVKEGLARLRHTSNPGLKALMECTGIRGGSLGAYHIGFILGPCLNASGRLDTAKRALALLEAGTKKEADRLAGDLKALNESRKDKTKKAVEEALSLAERTDMQKDRVLVLYLPDCHESIAGIVAGKVRERVYKPVFILTDSTEEGIAKGSGRSIEAYHMYEGLNQCRELFIKYGGHPMAAGLSMKKEDIAVFRERINACCTLTDEQMQEKIVIDMEMPFCCVTEELVRELTLLEPYGKGNRKPVFALRHVCVINHRILGKHQNVLKLLLEDRNRTRIEGLFFGDIGDFLQCVSQEVMITYYPQINEYQNRKTPQVVITHYRPC